MTARVSEAPEPPAHETTKPPAARVLAEVLRDGLGASGDSVRRALGLPDDATDGAVARALVQVLGATRNAALTLLAPGRDAEEAQAEPAGDAPSASADTSLLGRLGAEGPGGIDVARVREVKTLVALLRAGRRRQRLAALARLAGLLEDGDLGGEDLRLVRRTLAELRDVSLGAALPRARVALPGSEGRLARNERDRLQRLAERFRAEIARFWEGEGPEPLAAATAEDRATLLLGLPEQGEVTLGHVAATLERGLGAPGPDTEETRREVLAQLRYAGDPRLVPALVRVLESDVPGAVIDAARALANVRDPRVVPALRRRYARSVIDAERATLAGALGAHGVVAGQDYVRSLLDRDEADVLVAAMEALEELGGDADVERLRDRLDHPDEGVVFHAVEALGRIGDGRVMAPLGAVLEGGATASLRGAVEDARRAIEARLELRGEELPDTPPLPALERMTETAARASPFARFRARRLYAFGWLYLLLGLRRRGLAAFERAGELRPGWAGPPLAVGLAHARRGRHGQALAAFRRALAIDRRGVETSSTVMPFVARAFLRRAEELEDAGRAEVAAGLFAEALDLDLRRAPPALRFELERRRERPRLAGDLTPAPGASRRASRSGASS